MGGLPESEIRVRVEEPGQILFEISGKPFWTFFKFLKTFSDFLENY
jgi:hypothetical protein